MMIIIDKARIYKAKTGFMSLKSFMILDNFHKLIKMVQKKTWLSNQIYKIMEMFLIVIKQ